MHYYKLPLALLGLLAGVSGATAAEFDNTTLTQPPGVYFGTGNQNSNFTVDRTGHVETGLSAINRFLGPITPSGSTYTVPVGPTTVPGKTGSEWGFVFSVNLNYDGAGPYTIANTTSTLSMTDLLTGSSGSFVLDDNSVIGDNSVFGPSAFQNSETLSFANIRNALNDPGFNVWAADTYTFTLTVTDDNNRAVLSQDRITVNAVPEPLTISLFAAGLVGAGALRRRKKSQV